ncbi:MAG: hypothetical protein LBT36_04465 [Oscillospiraceae bacterium]|jgi:hypothetical protein|nr:hypothetical protein [Oscillospiraceae bacterium]
MKTATQWLKRFAQPLFVAAYALVCLLKIVAAGQNGGADVRFSVYELPAMNILQVLIYPAFLLGLFIAGEAFVSVREWRSPLGMVFSAVNLVFLFLLPIALRAQARRGWPWSWASSQVYMRSGYYLLYCLTIGYLMVYFVKWRLKAVDG